MSSVACPARQYFFTSFHKRHDFRNNVVECKMRVLTFSKNSSETVIVLRRTERSFINIRWSLCKVPVILDRF
jgi:hypothetical protein